MSSNNTVTSIYIYKTGVRFDFEIATAGMDISTHRKTIIMIIHNLCPCIRAL